MLTFLQNNWANLLIGGIVLVVFIVAVRSIILRHKKGGCGDSCGGCPYCGQCHQK